MVACSKTLSALVQPKSLDCGADADDFSFFVISKPPTDSQITKICASSDCKEIIAIIKKVQPTECVTGFDIALYGDVLNPINAKCPGVGSTASSGSAASSNATTPSVTTAAPTGAATVPLTASPSATSSAASTPSTTQDTSTATTNNASNGSNATVIIAAVAGAVAAIAIIVFFVVSSQDVAIKRLRVERRENESDQLGLLQEAKLLGSLIKHPRIVRFVGVAWSSPQDVCIAMELVRGRDLKNWLQATKSEHAGFTLDKARIALHVAEGLKFLHGQSPSVVHGALTSTNILLTEDQDAKIADFRLARETTNGLDEKADIFSFGVLLSELGTHEKPVVDSNGNVRLALSGSEDESLAVLALQCVDTDPYARPSAQELAVRMKEIEKIAKQQEEDKLAKLRY